MAQRAEAPTPDPLRLLARPDKWYLGAGDGLIWAPPFPVWLDAPGFWDEAHLFQYPIAPLFSLGFVADGVALPARCRARQWTPAALTLDHEIGDMPACETRTAPGGALRSAWEVRNSSRRAFVLDVVVWTALDAETVPAIRVATGGGGARKHPAGHRSSRAPGVRGGRALPRRGAVPRRAPFPALGPPAAL